MTDTIELELDIETAQHLRLLAIQHSDEAAQDVADELSEALADAGEPPSPGV